jgi:predicted nucleic acid-binding protein
MSDRIFIDTNIFIYAYIVNNDDAKHKISATLLKTDLKGKNICISPQVISEFYVAMARLKQSHQKILSCIADFVPFTNVADTSLSTVEYCLSLKERYGYSYWDSLILSSAIGSGCPIIYSEDMQNGQIIENRLLIQNPLIL